MSDHVGRTVGLDADALHWVGVTVRESVIIKRVHLGSAPENPVKT